MIVFDRTAWDRHLSSLARMSAERFGGIATAISRLNVLVYGYSNPVSRLPPSHGSNNNFFRLGIFCHTRQLEFLVCRSSELPFRLCIYTDFQWEARRSAIRILSTCKLGNGISKFPGVLSIVL